MTYNLVFRVRSSYFDQIIKGTKTAEIRKINRFWAKRAVKAEAALEAKEGVIAHFLCGRAVHRRRVVDFDIASTAAEALGREPSEQGRKDLGDGPVYIFKLGEVVR